MNLRQLRYFIAIVETGSFTAAAKKLCTVQPAVSSTLRKLESDLGVRLLVRDARHIGLTAEGDAFLRHARAILAQTESARREVASINAAESGEVRLGAPPMVASYLLPGPIAHFLEERPGIRLRIFQAGAEVIREQVMTGELDLGVIADWRPLRGLTTRLLHRHPIVAATASRSTLAGRHAISWAELFDHPLIQFPPTYFQRLRIEQAAAEAERDLNIVAESESVPIIIELVRRNAGVGTLLKAAAEDATGIRILTLPDDAHVPVAICHRTSPGLSAPGTALMDHLSDALGRRFLESR
ncbi:MAG: LysR family transcriptional regulator [Ectothiorhodospiraceae bacterium]|nr:LysR family transcriptional regulator [Ectothiorhodospiraceae bacterium]